MTDTFNFCPSRNVPETLPRDPATSTVSMNGWEFVVRPTTPYQRKFKVTLYGLQWYLNIDGTFDHTTNPNFNARALEKFYENHETWLPFTFKHQHFGDMLVRFAGPVTVPAGDQNSGGRIKSVEISVIQHNPAYYAPDDAAQPNPDNTYVNSTQVRANNSNISALLLNIQNQIVAKGG